VGKIKFEISFKSNFVLNNIFLRLIGTDINNLKNYKENFEFLLN
jgi:hypothetical protein